MFEIRNGRIVDTEMEYPEAVINGNRVAYDLMSEQLPHELQKEYPWFNYIGTGKTVYIPDHKGELIRNELKAPAHFYVKDK